ncbi:fimbria/pilus outer membrane usher protein [Photobacterium leiognathi]|uniref:fimbria/pilus outer membrane usher protein n=1 Tax=Photobacterium leiognathi TaxID=553611 RepID=UPI0027325FB5|nr:fimbria/pilus outer membrane usher protein [Photobacterium leiognathi]
MRRLMFGISLHLPFVSFVANSTELNLDFIHGVNRVPAIFTSKSRNIPGNYDVDVYINKELKGRFELSISKEDENSDLLCLTEEFLEKIDSKIIISSYSKYYNDERKCYTLESDGFSKADFNLNTQVLNISIPNANIKNETKNDDWDFGENAGRVNYNINASKSTLNDFNYFSNLDLKFNLGKWLLSSNVNINNEKITTNAFKISTPLQKSLSSFSFGRDNTKSNLLSSFSFDGLSFYRDGKMLSWNERGFAPTITGVLSESSRITIEQNGYIIYSEVLPSGPYSIDDLKPVSNGDLVVNIISDSGNKTIKTYPVSVLPSMLRSGDYRYEFSVGERNNSYNINDAFKSDLGWFVFGSFDYGLDNTTINSASIIHTDYQGLGLGFILPLGNFGTISSDIMYSYYQFDDKKKGDGFKFGFDYAKNISDKTSVNFLAYQYASSGFIDFNQFDPNDSNFIDQYREKSI